jgi:lysophospholipase L1-like esterase
MSKMKTGNFEAPVAMTPVSLSASAGSDLTCRRHGGLLHALVCMILIVAHPGNAADALDNNDATGKLVVLGASYAKGWPIAEIGNCTVVNQGIGGNQSFEMLERFQTDVVDLNPDVVILWGFINDIFRSDPGKMNATKDRIKRSYEQMISESKRHGIRVIVATEVSIREPAGFLNWAAGLVGQIMGKQSYQSKINRHVSDVNLWLTGFANSHDILVLDLQAALAEDDGRRKEKFAAEDGSHLTVAAYNELTTHATKTIQSACESKDSSS